jgi:tRNA A-37 threonylcarbamoyl transferase component Bud32
LQPGAKTVPLSHLLSFATRTLCAILISDVLKVKDTLRSTVNLTFDGRVIKTYHGSNARERFDNEVHVLRYLAERGCNFVPKLLEANAEEISITTTSCGSRVDRIDDQRVKELFAEVEQYGVRHDDPDPRNITYRQSDGRFCVIDFELATILSKDRPKPPE